MTENINKKPTKILLVDDKQENLIAMRKTLEPLKLEIITALSGNEALKLMLQHDFAVALLDVMMPIMNGFEVAELMHENDVTKHIPIIFVTAINKSDQNFIKGMEVGAIDFLYKPIDPVILLSKVRVFVDLYTMRAELETVIEELHEFHKQLEINNAQLKALSEEDMLTKAANRRHFENEMQRLMDKYKTNDQHLGLFFIDVDDFKSINDSFGHRVGDLVLIELVERIKKLNLNIEIIARLGGDEFALIIADLAYEPDKSESIAKLILNVIQIPFDCEGNQITTGVSIGIANYPEDGSNLTDLLRAADLALYSAKNAGKNTFFIKPSEHHQA